MRPSRAIWTAWAVALVGGLAVLTATILALTDPCAEGGPCTSRTISVAAGLAVTGTAVAVGAGLVAAYLTVRRPGPDRSM